MQRLACWTSRVQHPAYQQSASQGSQAFLPACRWFKATRQEAGISGNQVALCCGYTSCICHLHNLQASHVAPLFWQRALEGVVVQVAARSGSWLRQTPTLGTQPDKEQLRRPGVNTNSSWQQGCTEIHDSHGLHLLPCSPAGRQGVAQLVSTLSYRRNQISNPREAHRLGRSS
jgi:hypothetical protein